MSKYTPGPWKVHLYPVRIGIGGSNAAIDVGTAGQAVATVIGDFESDFPGKEAKANAHLIAAAPDLLIAAKFAWAALEKIEGKTKFLEAVKTGLLEAILKAEGEK